MNKLPIFKEPYITKGINGGKLIFEKAKEMTLFNLRIEDKTKTSTVWNPQKGEIPIKTPNAIENDFFILLSLL